MNRIAPSRAVPLADVLRTLAADLESHVPPPLAVPAAPAPAPEAVVPRRRRHAAWAGAAACLAVLAVSAWLMTAREHEPTAARASGFVPLVPPEAWPREGGRDTAWLVATELPNDRLAALGLPYDPGRAGETVRAELLMRASGEVLAVRLLR